MSWKEILKEEASLKQAIAERVKHYTNKRVPKWVYERNKDMMDLGFGSDIEDGSTKRTDDEVAYDGFVDVMAQQEVYENQTPIKRKKKETKVEDKPKDDYSPLW